MDILEQICDSIDDFLEDQFTGDELPCDIVYRKRGAPVWDAELKRNVTEEVDYPLSAILLRHTKKTVSASRVPDIQVGDRYYMVRYQDVADAGFVPSGNDVIVHDNQILDIKGFDKLYMFTYSFTVKGG